MSNIADKVVVITGASSGIGESTAKFLANQGAKVVLGARRSNRIDAVVQEITAAGGKAIGFATDVTKRAEVEALIQGAVKGFGRVDVLINVRNMRLRRSRTSVHGSTFWRTSRSPTFCRSLETLFFDGLAPRYS